MHATGSSEVSAKSAVRHPLDPSTSAELERAAWVALAAASLSSDGAFPRARVVDASLREPPKESVLAWRPGQRVAREIFVVLFDPRSETTHEVVVALGDGGEGDQATSANSVAGIQPAMTSEECVECEQMVRADPLFQEALRQRGVTDFDLVTIEAWGIGTHTSPEDSERRLTWTPCWVRDDPEDNPYAHPIDGLFAIVDLATMQILRIEDHGVSPIPGSSGRCLPADIGVVLRVR